jgi:hypothetical protein
MRHQRITASTIALAAITAGLIVSAQPSEAGLVTSCTGTASDVTIPGDLFVPAGESCELTNVTVTGNTTVRADADLILTDVALNGTLTVQSNGFANVLRVTVSGATRLNTAFGVFAEDSTLNGNITASDSAFFYSVGSTLGASVTSTNGETYMESGRLTRNLTTTGDILTDAYNSVIGGTVTVSGASLGSVFCTSEIDGNTSFANGGTLQLGGTTPVAGCGFNVFGASVAVTSNTDGFITGNVIRGDLACTGNGTAPVVSDNRIRGKATGQCAGTAAAASPAAKAADADSRKAGIVAKIKGRTADGQKAAVKAGAAKIGH